VHHWLPELSHLQIHFANNSTCTTSFLWATKIYFFEDARPPSTEPPLGFGKCVKNSSLITQWYTLNKLHVFCIRATGERTGTSHEMFTGLCLRSLILIVVLALSATFCLITDATAGGLFAVTLYAEPGWSGSIQFGSYGTFPSGTTIYVYIGAYHIAFIPSSNSSFYSWDSFDGVTVPTVYTYSQSGTAVVSGSGSLIAISGAYTNSVILTVTTTWTATSTLLTTTYYISGQYAPSPAPSLNYQPAINASAQTTEFIQPIGNTQNNIASLRDPTNVMLGGESFLSWIMFAAALCLSALMLFRLRRQETTSSE